MKFRPRGTPVHSEAEERQSVDELNRIVGRLPQRDGADLPPSYWSGLIVHTNARIDDVSSAKALSISWALRVAVPGVTAILFFFIGLHYYVPEPAVPQHSVAALVSTLPDHTLDSMLVAPAISLESPSGGMDMFQFSPDQVAEYLLAAGHVESALGELSDADIAQLLQRMNPGIVN
jgi:hypothetical protein